MTNSWTHLTFDLTYALSKKMALGFSLLHEKFDVSDYATINTAGPQTLPRVDVSTVTDNAAHRLVGQPADRLRQPAVQRDDGRRAGVLLLLAPADGGWRVLGARPRIRGGFGAWPSSWYCRPSFRAACREACANIETHSQIASARRPLGLLSNHVLSRRRRARRRCPPVLRLRAHPLKIVLVGNPNVGKSVIFGRLTGRYATVSNYPGTTVGLTNGRALVGAEVCDVIDSPGVNALEGVAQRGRAGHAPPPRQPARPTSSSRWPTRATCAAR